MYVFPRRMLQKLLASQEIQELLTLNSCFFLMKTDEALYSPYQVDFPDFIVSLDLVLQCTGRQSSDPCSTQIISL